jgi:hypothetical protein
MQTDEFERHAAALLRLAETTRVAAMCAEALPTHCHRSLLADALVAHGAHVLHITGPARSDRPCLTPGAHREGLRVSYPPRQGDLFV